MERACGSPSSAAATSGRCTPPGWRRSGTEVVGIDTDPERVERLCGRAARRSTSPASRAAGRHAWRPAGSSSRPTRPPGRGARCTSSASGPPRARPATRRTSASSRPPSTDCCRTCGPGTSSSASRPSRRHRGAAGRRVSPRPSPASILAWNPEFLREGCAVQDTLHPDRVVLGLPDGDAGATASERCSPGCTPRRWPTARRCVVTDYATAQLVKVAANAFLATKISFINAMSEMCEATRRRRGRAGRRDRARRPDRPAVPASRARVRRRLPAQGHPRLHRPRRRARGRRRARLPPGGRRDQPAAAQRGWWTLARAECGGDLRGTPDRRARRGVQAAQRRRPRLARPRDGRRAWPARAAEVVVTDPQAVENARTTSAGPQVRPLRRRGRHRRRARAAPDRVAGVRRPRPRTSSARWCATRRIVDGRIALDPAAWRAAGWRYRALGRR